MVAVIHFSKGFHRVLNYNEDKVNEQVATCLQAANYPKKAEDLTFNQRLKRLENQAALNQRTTVNGVHISLNFDPSEQFSDDKLREIASVYMDKIGFGEQPYLLYRHEDSGHPHVHIVTTNIKADGKRIELHNLGKVKSEKARKEIEQTYGLLRPEDSANRQKYELNPVNVQKVQYGKSATKRAITTVLNKVLKEYKFASLPELNAVLQQYNIVADRGSKDSLIYKNNGLTYNILNEDGSKVGVPIKASDIYNKPTLKFLEGKFLVNEPLRQPHMGRVKNAIDWNLLKKEKPSLQSLIAALSKTGIATIVRRNEAGLIYGLTYVDHQTKCVFKGSDLGKAYSAKAMLERCYDATGKDTGKSLDVAEMHHKDHDAAIGLGTGEHTVTDALLQQEFTGENVPYELSGRKKKKRKRLSNNNQ